ncbi:flagellar hook-length control protein FliK [Sulfurimonas sp.]
MINLTAQTDKNLKLIVPNTNKALSLALKNASPAELQNLNQTKELGTILDSLLKQSLTSNDTQNKLLLELLKNNPTLKSLSNATTTMKDLLQLLQQDKNPTQLEKTLQNFLSNIKDIHPKELQTKLEKSGVFLEAKIKDMQNQKEIFSSDLKAVLLKTQDELNAAQNPKNQEILKQIDKLTLQIDYQQLLSHLSNSTALYIPYVWEKLKDGNINIKKTKNKQYFCDIHLELKEYGAIDLRLAIFEKNQLSINITTENETLKTLLMQNIKLLKKQLINVGIISNEINFLEKKSNLYENDFSDDLAMGFEIKA